MNTTTTRRLRAFYNYPRYLLGRASHFIAVAFVVACVEFTTVQPAFAATASTKKGDTTLDSFIGCPSFALAKPASADLQDLTSNIWGLGILAMFIAIGFGAIAIGISGRRQDKAADGATAIKNGGVGIGIIVIGIPILLAVVSGLATKYC